VLPNLFRRVSELLRGAGEVSDELFEELEEVLIASDVSTEVSARIASLLREAVRQNCPAMIVVHNHPSGDPTPSEDDIKLTKRLAEAGEITGIDVLDHVIIGDNRYLSLKREGLF